MPTKADPKDTLEIPLSDKPIGLNELPVPYDGWGEKCIQLLSHEYEVGEKEKILLARSVMCLLEAGVEEKHGRVILFGVACLMLWREGKLFKKRRTCPPEDMLQDTSLGKAMRAKWYRTFSDDIAHFLLDNCSDPFFRLSATWLRKRSTTVQKLKAETCVLYDMAQQILAA